MIGNVMAIGKSYFVDFSALFFPLPLEPNKSSSSSRSPKISSGLLLGIMKCLNIGNYKC